MSEAELEEEEEAAAAKEVGRKKGSKRGKQRGRKGSPGIQLDPALLEGDFDPEAWDRQMAAIFNEEYYVGAGMGCGLWVPSVSASRWRWGTSQEASGQDPKQGISGSGSLVGNQYGS